MDALHKLVSFSAEPASALPHVAALLVSGILVGSLSARYFRYE